MGVKVTEGEHEEKLEDGPGVREENNRGAEDIVTGSIEACTIEQRPASGREECQTRRSSWTRCGRVCGVLILSTRLCAFFDHAPAMRRSCGGQIDQVKAMFHLPRTALELALAARGAVSGLSPALTFINAALKIS